MSIEDLKLIFNSLVVFFKSTLLLIFFYYLIISIFGWFRRKEIPAQNFAIKSKFAFIISAYNEEAVIGGAIRSLKAQNYPKDMFDIYVIADNCTDNTAKVALENGAKVYERFNVIKKGKGHSLEWMFKKLFNLEEQYTAICVLDADNLVSPNFLLEMNKQLVLGHKVIQGYLDSKNPSDSWISGNYSIAYWISNRLFQLPRHYLGLNCALGGTGFVVSVDVLKDIGWGATCLTEDLEFSLKLVLKGQRVSWAHEAIVYDEKPLRLSQSWKQRKRWMQGHSYCAEKYVAALFRKAILERDWVAFDSAMYLIQPFIIVANAVVLILGLVDFALFTEMDNVLTVSGLLTVIFVLFMTYINIVFIYAERKLTRKVAGYFLLVPFYSLTWIPIIIQGFLHRSKKEWVHTIHTRALDITDVEPLEKVG